MIRSLTLLNESGDTTIAWTEDLDDEIEKIVEKKMAEGVTFFIVNREEGTRSKLKDATEISKHRVLAIPDEDLRKFVEAGGTAMVTPDSKIKSSRVSRDAKEVAKSSSVGVRQRKGG